MEEKHIIINIGRRFGSGGRAVARKIGETLGIPVYDNEVIAKAADGSGFSKQLLEKSDERRSFFNLSSIFDSVRFGNTRNYIGDNELFKIQSEAIKDIASKGSAIFVGRCSNYILRDKKCLDVFITAPVEDRVKRVCNRENVSAEEALAIVTRQDRSREAYYNFFTFGNWGASSDYDLCIDSSALGIDGTADFIIDFGKKAGLI
jgi:hypothetical protein